MIELSVNRLDDTIKEILDYSRNARSALSVAPINLEKTIQSCFDKLKFMDRYADIKKSVNVKFEEPFFSDQYRLTSILQSLISNAIVYCDVSKSKKTLHIEAQALNNQQEVEIKIKDNGIGIENNYLDMIYNMFYRATDESKGAGLGLYIVKETLDKLKGSIKVESTLGEGTTFTVVVPNMRQ
jgi:signal transduction histidine kinase